MKITINTEQKQGSLSLPSVSNVRNAVAKSKLFSALTLFAILFGSCSSDDNVSEVNDGRVQFTSGVTTGIQTKVSGPQGDQWDGNESIGIFMRDNAAGKAIQTNNVKYTTATIGALATFTSGTPIYYPVSTPSKVDFLAYHPYAALKNNFEYAINVAVQSNQAAIDLMTAKTDNSGAGFDKTNTSPVNFNFKHQLAKVVINVTPGEGITNLTGLAVVMEGMNTSAKFDITTNAITNEADMANITPKDAGSNKYEAILLPVTLASSHVVKFTVGGNTYAWPMSANSNSITTFGAGKKYTFDVTLTKNSIKISGEIIPWDNEDGGTGTAK